MLDHRTFATLGRGSAHNDNLCTHFATPVLADVDFQIEIELGTIVKLADGFRIALFALVLGIDLVIHDCGKSREAVCSVGSDDVGLDGASAGIGEVDDGIREGVVLMIKNLAQEEPANSLVFLVERRARVHKREHQKETEDTCRRDHGAVVIHDCCYCLTAAEWAKGLVFEV